MVQFSRRDFLVLATGSVLLSWTKTSGKIMTVTGPVDVQDMGTALSHEHVLVDFIGADKTNLSRWNREEVIKKVVPYFAEAKKAGVQTIFECSPAFLGRDPELLRMISARTGVFLVTNTGYYGAVNNKYLPSWAFTETAQQLADRWINEFENGIAGTGIKPGFIKISVDAPETGLSDLHKKLVSAAAITHTHTGLTINSHTGPANAAFQQIDILRNLGVAPDAFVWVHAQAERDYTRLAEAAAKGAWVSLDNINNEYDKYLERLLLLKSRNLLGRVLISHDAGYYRPEEPGGGDFKGYTDIFSQFIPLLKKNGFTTKEVEQLLIHNPANAMMLKVRSTSLSS